MGMMMTYVLYFLTVVLPGSLFLGFMMWYDAKHVPVGQNFMPTTAELKALKESIL